MSKIDIATRKVVKKVKTRSAAAAVAFAAKAIWVADYGSGTISRIDPETGAVTRSVRVGTKPRGIV